MSTLVEAAQSFDCFGSSCSVLVSAGREQEPAAHAAVKIARGRLEQWHCGFSRFLRDSELSRLNDDPRETVRVSPLMARLAQAVIDAGSLTGGLVDGTLLEQIERAGYTRDLRRPLPLALALRLAPPRRPASAPPNGGWRQVSVDARACTIARPLSVKLDSGGLAKGLFADVLARMLAPHASFAIDCAGDLALGGAAGERREIHVASPLDGGTLHTFRLARGGVATSGIGRRSWLDRDGRPAHHLLDPSTGEPAFTGIVQATALAPSALLAEIYAKAAVLSGPRGANAWLPYGGVLVLDDGSHRVIDAPIDAPAPPREPRAARQLATARHERSATARRPSASSRDNARDARDSDRRGVRARDGARARGAARA